MRALATVFNRFPVRWQRRFMTAAHQTFLVGVVGIGVDADGRVLLARHRFGSPRWRLLGGFIARAERLEDALRREIEEETGLRVEIGPLLEAEAGYRWARIELVYAYRVTGGAERLSGELAELRWFPPGDLPEVRADQRGLIERHTARALAWLRGS
ncbi:MAG TPA: NUDIX domain-containing protein [Candidatus Limnocylindria bacterium]|nr:NUDIX domain-containing protein [Candidatus Limnocylindria bacterium]